MQRASTRLPQALLALRITVFLVMFVWTINKFVDPGHASAVFANFYFLGGIGSPVFMVLGAVELVIILLFLAGIAKLWSYGLVLVLHAVSTLSSWQQYLNPYDGANILFFAAWPMLGACFALFWLRDHDTLLTLGGTSSSDS